VTDRKKDKAPSAPDQDRDPGPAGNDRRQPGVKDRRAVRRGGRRAGDVFKDVATFIHQLLTEPPR
jgi:hypothetical protein